MFRTLRLASRGISVLNMASTTKPEKQKAPKRKKPAATTATFPSLHEDIKNVLASEDVILDPKPWFNLTGGDAEAIKEHDTNIMGRFECRNNQCSQRGWGSKKIAIHIRGFPGNGYNAVVYKQRCRTCERLGILRLDENSYVERIVFRLKRWAGLPVDEVEYEKRPTPPHDRDRCEGCKAGHCKAGLEGDWDST